MNIFIEHLLCARPILGTGERSVSQMDVKHCCHRTYVLVRKTINEENKLPVMLMVDLKEKKKHSGQGIWSKGRDREHSWWLKSDDQEDLSEKVILELRLEGSEGANFGIFEDLNGVVNSKSLILYKFNELWGGKGREKDGEASEIKKRQLLGFVDHCIYFGFDTECTRKPLKCLSRKTRSDLTCFNCISLADRLRNRRKIDKGGSREAIGRG